MQLLQMKKQRTIQIVNEHKKKPAVFRTDRFFRSKGPKRSRIYAEIKNRV